MEVRGPIVERTARPSYCVVFVPGARRVRRCSELWTDVPRFASSIFEIPNSMSQQTGRQFAIGLLNCCSAD